MKKQVAAILWRQVLQATLDTLEGESRGQYHITLTTHPGISQFFGSLERQLEGSHGGYTIAVPLEAYEGSEPVPAQTLPIKYVGPLSERRDWRIASQRPRTAYPLWREDRDPVTYVTHPKQYIVIVRDVDDKFHARWISPKGLERLPEELRRMFESRQMGIYNAGTPDTSLATDVYNKILEHHNVLIYGPPGTGKTHIMQQTVQLFEKPQLYIDTENEVTPITGSSTGTTKVGWVTFHQSYSYEEFIVGLRPDPESEKLLSLVPIPGLLLELAEFARQPGNSALLVIDEINRGNVSRIFGEFITLLEPDKRLDADGAVTPYTVRVQLPYLKPGSPASVAIGDEPVAVENPFTMPYGLYTLASMNSVDKSVAPLDSALRRRFYVYNLAPDLVDMSQHLGLGRWMIPRILPLSDGLTSVNDVKKLALSLLRSLNRGISFYLGPEYTLGQWYLNRLRQDFETTEEAALVLADTWDSVLLPQLEELFSGRVEQLETVLRLNELTNTSEYPVYLERPGASWQEFGATPYLQKRQVDISTLMAFLGEVAGVEGRATLAATASMVNSTAEDDGAESEPHTTRDLALDDKSNVDQSTVEAEDT